MQRTLSQAAAADFFSRKFAVGEKLTAVVLALVLISNLGLFYLFRTFRRNRSLKWIEFPNKKFWVSTPDLRLDALYKIRYMICLVAIWLNVPVGITQALIYSVYFEQKSLRVDLIVLLVVALALGVYSMWRIVPDLFRIPEKPSENEGT